MKTDPSIASWAAGIVGMRHHVQQSYWFLYVIFVHSWHGSLALSPPTNNGEAVAQVGWSECGKHGLQSHTVHHASEGLSCDEIGLRLARVHWHVAPQWPRTGSMNNEKMEMKQNSVEIAGLTNTVEDFQDLIIKTFNQ